jgi:C-terminal peptidase prc
MDSNLPFDRRDILVSLFLLMAIVLISGSMAIYVLSDRTLAAMFLLERTAKVIDQNYAEQLDYDQLIRSARRGMFAELDRYSGYLDREMFGRMLDDQSGGYSGIGVTVAGHDMGLRIVDVRPGGPAYEAGILVGDLIVGADSTYFGGMRSSEATTYVRGDEGTMVNLLVVRSGVGDTLTFPIERRQMRFQHVTYAGVRPDSTLYIRLADFDFGASEDIKEALDSLLGKEDMTITGILLDLRSNPGGLFLEAYRTADLFLDEGTFIVGTDGRSRWRSDQFRAQSEDLTSGLPMAVLVDGNSASSAEIVAGALQMSDRAILVGDTTYGKGLVQGFVMFPGGDALRLTISRYYLDGPTYLNEFDSTLTEIGSGLIPDYLDIAAYNDPFVQALEAEFLLERFAVDHTEEMKAELEIGGLSGAWIGLFADYCEQEEFHYQSEVAAKIATIQQIAGEEANSNRQLKQAIASLEQTDGEYTRSQFDRHQQYLLMRLSQIGWEQTESIVAGLREVLVVQDPQIDRASKLLKEQSR